MSVYNDILNAVAAALADVPGLPAAVVKDWPLVLRVEAAELPMAVVSPLSEAGERVGRVIFGGAVRWHYPILVLYLTAGDRAMTAGMPARLQMREDVRNALFVPTLPGAADVYDVEIDPRAARDIQASLGANVVVAGWRVVYRTTEVAAWEGASM